MWDTHDPIGKPCETCKGTSLDLSLESIMRTFGKRMDGALPGTVGVDKCPDCHGTGVEPTRGGAA